MQRFMGTKQKAGWASMGSRSKLPDCLPAVAAASLVLTALLTSGCRGPVELVEASCEPVGGVRPCSCPNGKQGQQWCLEGGIIDVCRCEGEDEGSKTPVDAGKQPEEEEEKKPDPLAQPDASPPDLAAIQCGEQTSKAVIEEERPVDVIFIIDNSGSMGDEITAVERNINENFARIIGQSGADYRLILLTNHGPSGLEICVEPPLAGKPCTDTTDPRGTTSGAPANTERFFHYDLDVQSTDSVCLLLEHYQYTTNPRAGSGSAAAPTGWHAWLRPSALKVFVEITDDGMDCSSYVNPKWTFNGYGADSSQATQVSRDIYNAILGLSPENFGTNKAPRIIWHSIVGVGENDPVELPFTHFDPLQTGGSCQTAYNVGAPYQMLSISTGGLRYPVCAADEGHGYDSVFRAIAHEVVRGSRVNCAFDVPTPPPGKFVDPASVQVDYTPGTAAKAQRFARVKPEACSDSGFYFEAGEIKLCPSTCDRVRSDAQAKINVVFGCGIESDFGTID